MTPAGSDPNQGHGRSKEEITAAILATADMEGGTKMRIMAYAFITYDTATDYLEKLMREGLIIYHPERSTYSTTEQGKRKLVNNDSDAA